MELQIKENVSLQKYNTFGMDVRARYFADIVNIQQLETALSFKQWFILGGGSNVLFTKDLDMLVLHMCLKGIEVVSQHENTVLVKVNAGEIWHDFVMWCLKHDFGGLENLSLIPGKAGAAPIQNIGAYGVEVGDCITEVKAMNTVTKDIQTFSNAACGFGYRSSIFNSSSKGEYIVTSVTFSLTLGTHNLRMEYIALENELNKQNFQNPSIHQISDTVIQIRQRKLPDYHDLGNAGSFFKNPIVSHDLFAELAQEFSDIPWYSHECGVKLAAGWMIEKAGWKGRIFKSVGVYSKQALILVQHGNALGGDVLALSQRIQQSVYEKFKVILQLEVQVV